VVPSGVFVADRFMAGPINDANPVGVEYDPEDWLAQVRAGKSFADFRTRRVHEPVSRPYIGEGRRTGAAVTPVLMPVRTEWRRATPAASVRL
jgi:hypothetical protein